MTFTIVTVLYIHHNHTMMSKSMMYRSLTLPRPDCFPAKRTALWLSKAVRVKFEQGGGLAPLSVGEDQRPVIEA